MSFRVPQIPGKLYPKSNTIYPDTWEVSGHFLLVRLWGEKARTTPAGPRPEVAHPKAAFPAVQTKARGHTGCRARVFFIAGGEERSPS